MLKNYPISQDLVDFITAKGFKKSFTPSEGNSEAYYYNFKAKYQFKIDRYRNLIKILDQKGYTVLKTVSLSLKQLEKFTEIN